MRAIWSALLPVALASLTFAQGAADGPADGGNKAEAQSRWTLPAKEAKKFQSLLDTYVHPGKKARPEILASFQKFVDKPIAGHSALEDVASISAMANRMRIFDQKIGRKGKVTAVEIKPATHGFPGGIGTVKYHLYLPKNYDPRKALWPVLFCLPNNKQWPEGDKYITEVWTSRIVAIEDGWIVVVPRPQTKGEGWMRPKSLARAMITLRHVMGTFGADKKTGGPASDTGRIVIDGGDAAANVAARFPEIFLGAILRNCKGRATGGPDVRRVGGLSGLAAYCIFNPKRRVQQQFAEKLKADNRLSAMEPALADDDKFTGDEDAVEGWLHELPARTSPSEVRYTVHEGSFQRHHWINVLEFDAAVKPAASFVASVDRKKNEMRIEVEGITRFELFLNDAALDLGKEITVIVEENDQELAFIKEVPQRSLTTMLDELVASNHPWRIYPVRYVVDLPTLRARRAAKEAVEAAKKDAEDKKQDAGTDSKPAKATKK